MEIRPFRAGDEGQLFDVYYSAIHEVACSDYTKVQLDAWAPATIDPELWRTRMVGIQPYVVIVDGRAVAYSDCQPNGYIDHFFVSGGYQGKGAGRLLMETIHDRAQELELSELTSCVSITAQPFYRHFGFKIVEQQSFETRGVVLENALMRKVL